MSAGPTVEVEQSPKDTGQWYFRIKSANGEIVHGGNEAYGSKHDAWRGAADLVGTCLALAGTLVTGDALDTDETPRPTR